MIAWFFLAVSLTGAWLTYNVYRPHDVGGRRSPVAYAELAGAQHAFEIFPSLRGKLVLGGVERFLALLCSRCLATREERTSLSAAG